MSDDMSWTEEDDAAVTYELLPDWHPSLFVDAVRMGLQRLDPGALEQLRAAFVTPESADSWGDFSEAQAIATSGLKISMKALWAADAPDVSYVRWVDTEAHVAPDLRLIPAKLHATLVWRPEIAVTPGSAWRLHALGDPVHPDDVPRMAIGFDPRKLG